MNGADLPRGAARPGRRAWTRLDNASNIFLAARSDADPKVFRISAEVDEEVDPDVLQAALDATYERYPLYHAVLRSGVFWYYLLDSDLRPLVTAETLHTCAPLYQADRRTLLFRVIHHRRRIGLEIFHALSDGTGALWFLSDLVDAYVRLRHPDEAPPLPSGGPPDAEAGAASATDSAQAPATDPFPTHELTVDSFTHYFRRRRRRTPADAAEASAPTARRGGALDGLARPVPRKVYRVRGTRTPDNRTRVVELTMPAQDTLALARAEGVSLTIYLTALFFEAVRSASGGLGASGVISASIPVNLRQFFPSTSARNFFATVRVEHRYGVGADDLGAICRDLERQFRPMASPEALEQRVSRLIRFERMTVLRIVPRVLKDVLLGIINRANNRGLTVAVSNLGRVVLPRPAEGHVGRVLFHVSAVRPQFCAVSHAGVLTVSFTSPFTETDHVREFARMLTARGVEVSVAAARVTEEELAEVEP